MDYGAFFEELELIKEALGVGVMLPLRGPSMEEKLVANPASLAKSVSMGAGGGMGVGALLGAGLGGTPGRALAGAGLGTLAGLALSPLLHKARVAFTERDREEAREQLKELYRRRVEAEAGARRGLSKESSARKTLLEWADRARLATPGVVGKVSPKAEKALRGFGPKSVKWKLRELKEFASHPKRWKRAIKSKLKS